jgi:hypothetical protein
MQAEVAELADALRSGRSESNLMRVQVPPSALQETRLQRRVFIFGKIVKFELVFIAEAVKGWFPSGL